MNKEIINIFISLVSSVSATLSIICGVIAFVGFSWESFYGLIFGGGLGWINLVALGWLCKKILETRLRKWPFILGLLLKFTVFILLIFLVVRYLNINIIGFVIGLSISILSLIGIALLLSVLNLRYESEG